MIHGWLAPPWITHCRPEPVEDRMDDPQSPKQDVPWPQRAFNSVWILAAAAMLYFFLSYVLWGLIDLMRTPAGG
jgi:hypothetical protein